jgi:hypothetical protein
MRAFLAALSLVAFTAAAQADTNDPLPQGQRAAVAAQTNARLAAHVGVINTGGPAGPVLLRSKGFASVTNPSHGLYCLQPAAGVTLNTARMIVQVTPDWSTSRFNNNIVQWRSSGLGCPARAVAIVTFLDDGADSYGLSNSVGFVVTVE